MTAHTRLDVSAASVHPLFSRRQPSKPHLVDHGAAPKQLEATRSAPAPLMQDYLEQVFELLPQGVLVLSTSQHAVYWNLKAQHLCRDAFSSPCLRTSVPTAILDICHRLQRRDRTDPTPLVMDYPTTSAQVIRARARWLHLNPVGEPSAWGRSPFSPPLPPDSWMVIFLEDRQETQLEDLRLQKEQYDLTERETEIWMLLQQDYSYQEIARQLQISLNTVKTHVKNIYAKRRGHAEEVAC